MTRSRGAGMGQVAGERHPAAKLSEADVALARIIARERALPRPWISDMARSLGVTDVALVMAIGGRSWQCVVSPRPVRSFERHQLLTRGRGPGSRPLCPACGHAKYYAVMPAARGGGPCRNRFHETDHRQFTSAANLRGWRQRRTS